MSGWLPYDQSRLESTLHATRADLALWLDDHRTLQQLARARRHRESAHALALTLVGPRLRSVSGPMGHTLVARAQDTLTQAHLSRHLLFHVFHTPAIDDHARSVFGVSPATFRRLRDEGLSPQRIGARGGRSVARVRSGLSALLVARGGRGVATGAQSPAQARALWAEQRANLGAYVSRRFRTPSQQVQFICHPH